MKHISLQEYLDNQDFVDLLNEESIVKSLTIKNGKNGPVISREEAIAIEADFDPSKIVNRIPPPSPGAGPGPSCSDSQDSKRAKRTHT